MKLSKTPLKRPRSSSENPKKENKKKNPKIPKKGEEEESDNPRKEKKNRKNPKAKANSPDFGDAQSCGSDSALGPQDKDSKQRALVSAVVLEIRALRALSFFL